MISEFWNSGYNLLALATTFPIIASVLFYFINKTAEKKNVSYMLMQIIIGIVFGAIAIIGTEWGIPLNGAVVNCRDAAPICAGLIFGGPAGIIAGLIGGIERYAAVAWGVGSFTRIACSVSTALAGIYAAMFRKYMFANKMPSWIRALAVGTVMEVFHLMMVFVTNMHETERAIAVVKACSIPMIVANGIAVALAVLLVTGFSKGFHRVSVKETGISQIVQRGLLFAVIVAFALTSVFLYVLQNNMAEAQSNSLIDIAINDTIEDIESVSNDNLVKKAQAIAFEMLYSDLNELGEKYSVEEINIVNEKGIITDSTNPGFIGFDMTEGEQSREFMCLVDEKSVFCQPYGPISYNDSLYRKYVGVAIKGGFVQVGLNSDQFKKSTEDRMVFSAKNRHVGKTGMLFIFDENFKTVSYPLDFQKTNLKNVEEQISDVIRVENTAEGQLVRAKIFDVEYLLKYQVAEGNYVIGIIPIDEVLSDRDSNLYINSFLEILVFALLFAMINIVIQGSIIGRMKKINEGLGQIAKGNLDTVIDERSNVEFNELSNDINHTVNVLKGYIDEAAKKYEEDMATAKTIQSSVLPSVFPAFPKRKDFEIYASMDTAKEVGGDFYDFYLTDSNILNFIVADVSGKGVPGAMFMMRARTELKTLTETDIPVNEVFSKGNETLCEGNDAGMFVTGWQGKIDLNDGSITYANAGHNPPIVIHKDGNCEYIKGKINLVLAGMEGSPYVLQNLKLESGDKIFLYTDGVTEATDSNNELYEEQRLIDCIRRNYDKSCKEICEEVKVDVDAFVKEAPQFDDITMLCLEYRGHVEKRELYFEEVSVANMDAIVEFCETELEKMGCPMKEMMQINIAVDEFYSNIANYAYGQKKGFATISLEELVEPKHGVLITFTDEGKPYNPLKKEDPDTTLSAEERGIGGLGIFMAKDLMDEIEYAYRDDKNILMVKKYF